jgi:hypothetical protein
MTDIFAIKKLKSEIYDLYDKRDEAQSMGLDSYRFYQEEIKSKLKEIEDLEVVNPNPDLTQLKADARAFDEAHGLNEEIDISKIEF